MVRRYFEERDLNIDNITYNDKQRVLFDRYLHGEIDVNILIKGLETLESKINQKDNQHLGYA